MKVKKIIAVVFGVSFTFILINGYIYSKCSKINNENTEVSGEITFATNRIDKKEEIKEIINDFQEINPNIKVNLEVIGNVEEILKRRASVGELPDVTLVPASIKNDELKDYFLPLDDLGFSDDNINNYNIGTDEEGNLYTMSASMIWLGVIYNKQAFREAGITDVPKTAEEFFEDCKKIKEKGIIPIALNYKQSWLISEWVESIPYLFQPDIEKEVSENNKEILSEDSGMFKSLEFARKIVKSGYCEKDLLNYEWEQCKNDLKDGKTAMVVWSSDLKNQLVEMGADKDNIGMFPVPESRLINIVGDYQIGVSKNSKYPEAAKEFFKFLFEDSRYAKAVKVTSSMKDSRDSEEMLNEISKFDIELKYQADTLKNLSKDDKRNQTMYLNTKRLLGVDYAFVQNYITSQDTKKIIEDLNKSWRNIKYEK